MAVNASKLSKTGRRSALALALLAVALPGIAAAQSNDEDRGRERSREAREADGNIGASGWQRPAPQVPPQRSWQGGGNGGGGWNRADAARNANLGGERAPHEGRADGQSRQVEVAPVPAPAPRQRWSGSQDYRGGAGWNRPADRRSNTNAWQGRDGNREREREHSREASREHDGNRWRGNEGGRDPNWNRSQGWNGVRGSTNHDYRRWDNRWRGSNRYDWHSYRRGNPGIYRLQPYYSPYRGYRYQRLSIGFFLDSLFFSQNYWISDPWQYRLPDVYGPYRWVRYYDDALLVNVYTGEVVDVIHDFFW